MSGVISNYFQFPSSEQTDSATIIYWAYVIHILLPTHLLLVVAGSIIQIHTRPPCGGAPPIYYLTFRYGHFHLCRFGNIFRLLMICFPAPLALFARFTT